MGAKNHGVIMPDANKEQTLNQLVGAAFGAAGQRCMALSTVIFINTTVTTQGNVRSMAVIIIFLSRLYLLVMPRIGYQNL
jgi:hypothetical protein